LLLSLGTYKGLGGGGRAIKKVSQLSTTYNILLSPLPPTAILQDACMMALFSVLTKYTTFSFYETNIAPSNKFSSPSKIRLFNPVQGRKTTLPLMLD
jgi:hypothetical protein